MLFRKEIKELSLEFAHNHIHKKDLTKQIESITRKNKIMKKKKTILNMQIQSIQDNLMFSGIPEGYTWKLVFPPIFKESRK